MDEQAGAPLFNVGSIVWVLRDGQVLLVRAPGSPVVVPPGGILEGDETPVEAGLRELFEETGLRPDGALRLINVHRVQRGDQRLLNCSFVCECASGDVVLSAEHEEFVWMDATEYRDLVAAFAPSIGDPQSRRIAETLLSDLTVICG